MKDQRATVAREHPEMNPKEIFSELGRRWKNMSDEEKKPYQTKAEVDKRQYWKVRNPVFSKSHLKLLLHSFTCFLLCFQAIKKYWANKHREQAKEKQM